MSVEGRQQDGVPLVNAPAVRRHLDRRRDRLGDLRRALRARAQRPRPAHRYDADVERAGDPGHALHVDRGDGRRTARAALEKINELRHNGGTYKEQLDVILGVRPVIGNIYYRCYKTTDGFVAVGCLSTPLRVKLLGAIGMRGLAHRPARPTRSTPTDPEALRAREALVGQAEAIFAAKTTEEWLPILDAAGVPAGPLRFTEELLDDEQVIENNYVVSVDHPLMGPVRMAGPMIQMSETPLAVQGPSPTLGQHTDDVLRELGYDDARIDDLRARGVLHAAGVAAPAANLVARRAPAPTCTAAPGRSGTSCPRRTSQRGRPCTRDS